MRAAGPGSERPVVLAFGGNVLMADTTDPAEQGRQADRLASRLLSVRSAETPLLLVHGNGPQVGNALLRAEQAERAGLHRPPLDVLVAETQATIGYLLAQAIHRSAPGLKVSVLLTRVVVTENDPAFSHPSKPIGPYYPPEEAADLRRERAWPMVEVDNRGWRRVVPSPRPHRVVELDVIRHALRPGSVVIAGGGGGIPVAAAGGRLIGVEAVIDKDRTASLLAIELRAARLLIVTGEAHVARRYGTEAESRIPEMRVEEAHRLLEAGEFPPGSMGPKVESAAAFVKASERPAIITDTDHLTDAIDGSAGTVILPDSFHGTPEG